MHIKTAFVLLSALASTGFVIGCGSGGTAGNDGPQGVQRASLHRAKNCDDLLGDLKADAVYKLNRGIDRQIQVIQACRAKYPDDQCAYGGWRAYDEGVADAAGGAAPPRAPGEANAGSGGVPSSESADKGASSYSETNTQVKGVDEADIVKNDGQNLYVLHGRSFKVLNAWPATELKEVASLDVEGQPTEMFVADGKVVVYSQVNGVDVFAAAGVTPKEQYQAYGYYDAPGVARDVAVAPMPPGGWTPPGKYVPLTKVTVMRLDGTTPVVTREVYFEGSYLDARRVGQHVRTVLQGYAYGPKLKHDISELYPQPYLTKDDGSQPVPNPEYREGQYPKTGSEMISALEKLRAENIAAIQGSQLGEWLPYTFVKEGAAVTAKHVACEDFYVPTVGSTENGMTEVASLDLADPAAVPKETAILGRADTVYGNAGTLYLAAHAWVEPPFVWSDPGGTVSSDPGVSVGGSTEPAPPPRPAPDEPAPAPQGKAANTANVDVRLSMGIRTTVTSSSGSIVAWSNSNTHVHKFEFASDPTFPNYVASGTVSGAVKDQFSLDEKDGFLRIATTENRQYVTTDGKYVAADFAAPGPGTPPIERPSTVNHLFVLEQQGPWLELTGDVGELAPNERIFSVRFVENRGYVVTFRQVDPLFVVDLATPSKPALLAALKIPGFSEYMHPLDANHLLTIGRDATTEGRAQGLQLKIFDVTNGANPIVKYEHTYSSQEHGSSEAEYDHKAFTYFADRGLLAFPYMSYGDTMRSSLEIFKVGIDTGFTKLGSIDHTGLVKDHYNGYCGGYYSPSVRRGVFLENFVYSVSYGGVVVKDANDLLAPATSELALPSPTINEGYGPACY